MNRPNFGALALCLAPFMLSAAAPAAAQSFPSDPGVFWDVSLIDVADGGDTAYTTWLATEWKKQEEFAKSKGWIKDYKVVSNLYPRPGEPDLYLITIYDDFPNAKAMIQQRADYIAFYQKTAEKLDAESGDRGKFRTIMGTMLLQELKLK
ncbi:MAG TPA: hypothetical protein VF509_01005 [Sphingobium sp.]